MAEPDSNVIAAFSEDHVERLTGVTKEQLRYWDRTGFFKPEFADANRRAAFSRVYSFKNVAALRVLHALRNKFRVPLQHLRRVARELAHLSDEKWTANQLFVVNRRVVITEPGSQRHREVLSGQYVFGQPLAIFLSETRAAVDKLLGRNRRLVGKIDRARNINHNAWVVAGTRIPVAALKRLAEDGYSLKQIRDEYPTLKPADIRAALAHESNGKAA